MSKRSTSRRSISASMSKSTGDSFLVPKQSEQEVLRPDVVVTQRAGLVLRGHEHLPSVFGEALEHPSEPSAAGTTRSGAPDFLG
jgi:hypothetical protein